MPKTTRHGGPSNAADAVASEPEGVPEGTAAEILEWVGDDPQRARAALEAEQASSSPRVTLVATLERKAR